MKIWPFDIAAEANDGVDISSAELKTALEPFEKIRRAVGDNMEIMVEFHSLWQLLPAIDIAARARAIRHQSGTRTRSRWTASASLKRYAEASPAPICASETLGTRWAFRDLLETGAAGVVMLDISWCGGLSEAKQDRRHGRGLAPAGRAARLHRAGRALRLDASVAQRARTRSSRRACAPTIAPGTAIS